MLLKHDDFNLAVGVDWVMPGSQKEAKSMRRERSKSDFVLVQYGRQILLGTHESLKQSNVHAGALLVALIKPNSIIIHPVDDENVWVCAILDGIPAVGYDKVFTNQEGREKVIEWSSAYFTNAEIIGDMVGASGDLASVLAEVKESIASKSIKKKQLSEIVFKSTGANLKVFILLAIICASAAAGYIYYNKHKEAQKKLILESANQINSSKGAFDVLKTKAEQEALRAQLQAKFNQDVAGAKKLLAERVPLLDIFNSFDSIKKSMPISLYGYRPERIECGIAQCKLHWMGSGKFTRMADKLLLPNVEQTFNPDFSAVSNFPFTSSVEVLKKSPGDSKHDYMIFLMRDRFLNVATFDAPTPISITPPAGSDLQAVEIGHSGKVRVKLQGPAALIGLADTFKLLNEFPIKVTSLKYQIGSPSIDIDGEYVFLKE